MTACRHIPASRWPTGGPKGSLSLSRSSPLATGGGGVQTPNQTGASPHVFSSSHAPAINRSPQSPLFFYPLLRHPLALPLPSTQRPPYPAAARVSPPLPAHPQIIPEASSASRRSHERRQGRPRPLRYRRRPPQLGRFVASPLDFYCRCCLGAVPLSDRFSAVPMQSSARRTRLTLWRRSR